LFPTGSIKDEEGGGAGEENKYHISKKLVLAPQSRSLSSRLSDGAVQIIFIVQT
jgi:hypothetical protein